MTRSFLLLPFLISPAFGDTLAPDEISVLPRLIDQICLEMDDDSIGCETFILLEGAEQSDRADLVLLPDHNADHSDQPFLILRNFTFNGAMWGMQPSFERAENGSLMIHSEQTGIGRHPWTQTLTVAFREGDYVVAGFSYLTYDRVLAHNFNCDVNLLTGDFETMLMLSGEEDVTEIADSGRLDPAPVLLRDWSDEAPMPAPCREGLSQMPM